MVWVRGPVWVPIDPAPSVYCSKEMCDQQNAFTMCPLCDKSCDYWNLSSACGTARASHLFDNPATVFFSIFMALWGKLSFLWCFCGLSFVTGIWWPSPQTHSFQFASAFVLLSQEAFWGISPYRYVWIEIWIVDLFGLTCLLMDIAMLALLDSNVGLMDDLWRTWANEYLKNI